MVGRPRKVVSEDASEMVAENQKEENLRPRRSPMDGNFRDRLGVFGKDPNYEYRWVLDTDSSGARIHWMTQSGWELAQDAVIAGSRDATQHDPNKVGSTPRVPANKQGEYHYLMRIKKEWYDEDQKIKANSVEEMDKQIHTRRNIDGVNLYDDPSNTRTSELDKNPMGV